MNINIFGIKVSIRKYQVVVLAVLILFILAYIGHRIQQRNSGLIINAGDEGIKGITINSDGDSSDKGEKDESPSEEIKVYVTGCVNNPGVVTLKKGQIIEDAINAAGGPSEDADMENINLVYELNSNVMIKICSKYESESGESENAAGGAVIIRDTGNVVKNSNSDGKININTASLEELMKIPGIGEATARDIILYRETSGRFYSIEDIMKVKGIKKAKFSAIKDMITAD
jgi:competence protein ComEA